MKSYIAVDLGAESGRIMLGTLSNDKVQLQEIYRFENGPVSEGNSLRWDYKRIFSEIKTGISQAVHQSPYEVLGIGVDSWGVDFGLIDRLGQLLGNPFHYRNFQKDAVMDKAFELVERRLLYENTGIQLMPINSVFQLLSIKLFDKVSLEKARRLLFTADLYSYLLCGKEYAEYSLASTSQLMNMRMKEWSPDIFRNLSLPLEIMPVIVQPGTIMGPLKKDIASQMNCKQIPVIAVCSHDTASAVAAIPAINERQKWAYLSSGTWSLMGVEIKEPIINEKSYHYQFTNEGGVEGTIRFLKNIMGLWLVQECRRQWQKEGFDFSYSDLTDLARQAEPFKAIINPNYHSFLTPGNMPKKIQTFLLDTNQKVFGNKNELMRIILESLALYYRWVIDKIIETTNQNVDCLHIVGGGIQNELLCQFTADATGKKTIASPIEAAAIGNILMQAKAVGQVRSLSHIRRIVHNSFEIREYLPQDNLIWEEQYLRAKNFFNS